MRTTTAALLGLAFLLSGCAAGSDQADRPEPRAEDRSSSRTTGEPAPPPILLGTQRYVSPCRVLDPDDLTRIYGDPGKYASFRQEIVEKSVPTSQMQVIDGTVGGSVRTRCSYSFDNAADTTIGVEVAQYVSPRSALRRWKEIRRLGTGAESRELAKRPIEGWEFLLEWARENEANQGGVNIKGLDPTVLFVAGRTNFVGVRRNLLITVERKDYAGTAFEPKEVKGTLAKTRQAFRQIYANVDDPALDQSPLPAWWEQQEGWPQFLDPCAAFDDTAMRATTRQTTSSVESDSVLRDPNTRIQRNDRPAWKAVHNECSRSARRGEGVATAHWHGDIELWYAAPGDTGSELLEGFVVKRLFDDKAERKYGISDLVKAGVLHQVEVGGAERAYVFDYRRSGSHYSWIVFNVGRHVVLLDATRTPPGRYKSIPMGESYLVAGAEQVAHNISAAVDES